MHIGSSLYFRCTLFAGTIILPAAISARICSGERCGSRRATRFISAETIPCAGLLELRAPFAILGPRKIHRGDIGNARHPRRVGRTERVGRPNSSLRRERPRRRPLPIAGRIVADRRKGIGTIHRYVSIVPFGFSNKRGSVDVNGLRWSIRFPTPASSGSGPKGLLSDPAHGDHP